MYLIPRAPAVGEQQLAVRVQDRDYRIMDETDGRLEVMELATGEQRAPELKPGPGRDWRAWVDFPRPGEYSISFAFTAATGQTRTARFEVQVPKK